MDEDCERIRLGKDVRDDVCGQRGKEGAEKEGGGAGLLERPAWGWARPDLGGRKKWKSLRGRRARAADKTHWPLDGVYRAYCAAG